MSDHDTRTYDTELETAVLAARAAGTLVNDFYERAAVAVYEKADGSPVTDADLAADALIRDTVSSHFPGDAVLTEESADDPARLTAPRVWIVDPIDGTAQFIARTGRFDIVVALVVDGRPVLGVICHPPSGTLLTAIRGHGAWIEERGTRRRARISSMRLGDHVRIAGSIWFGMPELESERDRVVSALGGQSAPTLPTGIRPIDLLDPERSFDVVFGPVADADRTYGGEWDFAAPDLIIREAGGAMSDLLGRPHRFNKANVRNGGGLIYSCDPATHARVVVACAAGLPPGLEESI